MTNPGRDHGMTAPGQTLPHTGALPDQRVAVTDPASSAQDVTPAHEPDQRQCAADPGPSEETLLAVTAALDQLAYWAQRTGGPSAAAEKATIIAVGVYGFTLTTNATRVRFVDSEGRAHSVARVLLMHRYDQVKAGRCDTCGQPIPLTAYRRQRRGARSDRRYCSNACRQRAHRQRSRTS